MLVIKKKNLICKQYKYIVGLAYNFLIGLDSMSSLALNLSH